MRQFILCFLFLAIISCSKNSNINTSLFQRDITKIEGDLTGIVNQPIPLTVYWPYISGCDVLDKFEETKEANIIFIKAYGHNNEGACTHDAGLKRKEYSFSSKVPGTFELRFIKIDNSYISHFITIS